MSELGKLLVLVGVLTAVAGAVLLLAGKTPLGRLPGDIVVRRENFTFYFPLATGILVSVILSLLVWLIFRLRQ